jgi:hypothetical protein
MVEERKTPENASSARRRRANKTLRGTRSQSRFMHLFFILVTDRLKAEMENLEEEIWIAARKLYPMLDEAEAKQAGENLCRYFETVLEISCKEAATQAPKVDTGGASSSIRERSNLLKT